MERKVAGSTPGQGTGLGFGPAPGWAWERQLIDCCFSHTWMFSSFPSPLSKKINKVFKKKRKGKADQPPSGAAGGQLVTVNVDGASFWGDESVLRLDHGEGCAL